MAYYIVKLLLMLVLVAGLAVGCLLAFKRYNELQAPQGKRLLRIIETLPMSPTAKLAVVAFGDKHILLAVSRNGIVHLSQSEPDTPFQLPADDHVIGSDHDQS